MICDNCDTKLKVIHSRHTGYGIRRRRECPSCTLRITTIEVEVEIEGENRGKGRHLGTIGRDLVEWIERRVWEKSKAGTSSETETPI